MATIRVADETADELHNLKKRGDSYDDVVRRLLERRARRESVLDQWGVGDQASADEPQSAPESDGSPEPVAVDDQEAVRDLVWSVDLPGSGEVLITRQKAVLECLEYLLEEGRASKQDFINDIYSKNPAGYESAGGWWNAIGKVGLRELADRSEDVHPPAEGGVNWWIDAE